MNLTSAMFDVAVGLFYAAFCLLAIHWLAEPVLYVLAGCRAVSHVIARGLRGAKWSTLRPTDHFGRSALNDLSGRLRRACGLAGATLLGTSGALFLLAAIVGLFA